MVTPPALVGMIEFVGSDGAMASFTCVITHYIPNAYFTDPTIALCPSGRKINIWVEIGCQEPIIRKELGKCTTCPEQGKLQVGNPIAVANGNKAVPAGVCGPA